MWYRILPSTSSPSQLFSICLLFTTVLLSVSAIAIPSGSVSASQQHQKRNVKKLRMSIRRCQRTANGLSKWMTAAAKKHPDDIYALVIGDNIFAAELTGSLATSPDASSTQTIRVIPAQEFQPFQVLSSGRPQTGYYTSLKASAQFSDDNKQSAFTDLRNIDTLQTKCGGKTLKSSLDYVDCALDFIRNKFVPSDDRSELNAIWAPYKAKWTNDIADAANQIKTFRPDSLLRIGRKKSGKKGGWVKRWVEHHPDDTYVLLFQDEPFAAEATSTSQAVEVIEKGKLPTFPLTVVGNSKYLDANFFSSMNAYALFYTAEDKNSAVHNLRDIDTLQPKCGGVFKNSFDYVDCAVGYFKDNYARSEDKPRLDEMWKVYKAKRDGDLQNA
ncbi:hypothetical protein C8J55DRAFT_524274 [Lentinula edodes]|uniref:Uncharacterized protein n=1 Tax=Lentinula lateritia TaxID=40482 RepID=A0A9W8ZX07_9AGAR|nr:hypothetical protein C8J55DRAFT_524274 [Lentinula edodes]